MKQETRTRNLGRNDHRGLSSLTAILNQEATIKRPNTERKRSKASSTFNSTVMRKCMDIRPANPQGADSVAPKKKKLDRSKYLTNNLDKSAQMQSAQGLDSRRRVSAMRNKSSIFDTKAAPERFLGSTKTKTHRPRNNVDVILAYDLGPVTKFGFDRRSNVQGKVSS